MINRRFRMILIYIFLLIFNLACFFDSSTTEKIVYSLVLEANKTFIQNNDEDTINFKISYYENNEKKEYNKEILNFYINGKKYDSLEFKTLEKGDFVFYAELNGTRSNYISIEVDSLKRLELKADKFLIKNDNIDKSILTVKYYEGGEEKLYNEDDLEIYIDGEKYDLLELKTFDERIYEFYVILDKTKSNTIEISVEASKLAKLDIDSNKDGVKPGEELELLYKAHNQFGEEIEVEDLNFYNGVMKLEGNNFSSTELGYYYLWVEKSGLSSQEMEIMVHEKAIRMSTEKTEYKIDEEVRVLISTENLGEIGVISVGIAYDKTYLSDIEYNLTKINSSFDYSKESEDGYEVILTNTSLEEPQFTVEGNYCIVSFKAKKLGESEISFFKARAKVYGEEDYLEWIYSKDILKIKIVE